MPNNLPLARRAPYLLDDSGHMGKETRIRNDHPSPQTLAPHLVPPMLSITEWARSAEVTSFSGQAEHRPGVLHRQSLTSCSLQTCEIASALLCCRAFLIPLVVRYKQNAVTMCSWCHLPSNLQWFFDLLGGQFFRLLYRVLEHLWPPNSNSPQPRRH